MLEKPKLFSTLKQFWLSMLLLISILLVHLFYLYGEYQTFKEKPFFYTKVEVLQVYEKWKKDNFYTVIKLYSPILDISFFSKTKIRAKEITPYLRIKIFPNHKMKFRDYLGTSFISSNINEIYKETSFKSKALDWLREEHKNSTIANFYNAIYFAEPLGKKLRQKVSLLGVSHLIALSGFHLAILSTLLFFILRPLYRVFQQRYFPYRFDLIDVGFIVLLLLIWYLWFVGSPPSLLRSYMMMFMGWIFLILGIELITLSFLTTVTLLLLVIFPKLIISLAFWFSIIGVLYIFLLLHYYKGLNKYLMTIIISFGIFTLMLPIVHTVFSITTPIQLFSPFLSLAFSLFYPMSMGLHLLGIGDSFDFILQKLFSVESRQLEIILSYWLGGAYLMLSIVSFFFIRVFYLLLFLSGSFFIWLFIRFLL
jgi:competence protein ComEC